MIPMTSKPALAYSVARSNRAMEVLIQDSISNMFAKWGDDKDMRLSLHASSLIEPDYCGREYVLAQEQPGEAEPAERKYVGLNAIFVHGWWIHKKWQAMFKEYGCVVYTGGTPELDKTHYSQEYNLYYSPDAIIYIGEPWYPVEIKGLNTEEYQKVCDLPIEQAIKGSDTIHKALKQINIYMHLLSLGQGIILAEDKNTQKYRVWLVNYDPSVTQPYIERASRFNQEVFTYRSEQILPEKHKCCETISSARARRCPMRELCFGLEGL